MKSASMLRSLLVVHLYLGQVSRFDRKKELYLYFSLDTILKKHIKQRFLEIKEYRHRNAVENFEFQIMYFNKYTQTYRHYFHPSHVSVQTDAIEVFDATNTRLTTFVNLIETKLELNTKSAFMAVVIQSQNNIATAIDDEVKEKQRKINRKLEWATINEGKKADAQTKFFLVFLMSFHERKQQQMRISTFDLIEKENYNFKLRKIALRNIIALGHRVVAIEFDRFKRGCLAEQEPLRYDHAAFMKGLYLLKCTMRTLTERVVKSTISKIRLETRPRSRRSIIGMTRPSLTSTSMEKMVMDKRRSLITKSTVSQMEGKLSAIYSASI
jgi:hypothetical protein